MTSPHQSPAEGRIVAAAGRDQADRTARRRFRCRSLLDRLRPAPQDRARPWPGRQGGGAEAAEAVEGKLAAPFVAGAQWGDRDAVAATLPPSGIAAEHKIP